MEDNENVENNEQQPNVQNENVLLNVFNEVLKGVNFNDAINSINKTKESTNFVELKKVESTNKVNIRFWTLKFIKEFLVVIIILISICYLSSINKIDNCTIGTLLGSIIGYAIGNFTSSNNSH